MAFSMFLLAVLWAVLGLILGLSFIALRRWARSRGHGAWGAVFGLLAFGALALIEVGVLAGLSMLTG